jgi:hypothetical protein
VLTGTGRLCGCSRWERKSSTQSHALDQGGCDDSARERRFIRAWWTQQSNEAVARAARELTELVERHLPQCFYAGEHSVAMSGAAIITGWPTIKGTTAFLIAVLPTDGLNLLRALYE